MPPIELAESASQANLYWFLAGLSVLIGAMSAITAMIVRNYKDALVMGKSQQDLFMATLQEERARLEKMLTAERVAHRLAIDQLNQVRKELQSCKDDLHEAMLMIKRLKTE